MAREHTILPDEFRSNFVFVRVVGPRHSLSMEMIREWLDVDSRPGIYCFGQRWLADEDNFSPRDCIEVAITDNDVALEFKMRWV